MKNYQAPQCAVINLSLRLRLITANFGLDNSSYRAKPHSIIVKCHLRREISLLFNESYEFRGLSIMAKAQVVNHDFRISRVVECDISYIGHV
jgi:hypothetical protein